MESSEFCIFFFEFFKFFKLFFFCFISFANLKLNQLTHTHTENKDINDTIQAGTPQQLAPITAGPQHIKWHLFSPNENETVKQNNQSDFKVF